MQQLLSGAVQPQATTPTSRVQRTAQGALVGGAPPPPKTTSIATTSECLMVVDQGEEINAQRETVRCVVGVEDVLSGLWRKKGMPRH